MARKLGIRIVAEGVENKMQFEILTNFGCDEMQGYLFSKPLPSDSLLQFLKSRQK